MKKKADLSPNFNKKSRPKKEIKFIIIHYTGMQSEIESLKKLCDHQSKVSCHYFINRKGKITQLVKDNKVAWHAVKSKWKNYSNLNLNSIGIELVNKGHQYGYQRFPKIQINSLIDLCKKLKAKYNIKTENFLGHSDIAPMRKIDPGEKFPWKKLSFFKLGYWYKKNRVNNKTFKKEQIPSIFFKNLYKIGYRYFKLKERHKADTLIIKIFQQRYLPNNVTGKIDQKTFEISHFLAH